MTRNYNLQKNLGQYLHMERLKIGLFRFLENFCYLNFLKMVLNESSCNIYCLVANPPI